MSKPRCEVCGMGVDVGPLYRNSPIGTIGTWRCFFHTDPKFKPDEEVVRISEAITKKSTGEH